MGERKADGLGPSHVTLGSSSIQGLQFLARQSDRDNLHWLRSPPRATSPASLDLIDVVAALSLTVGEPLSTPLGRYVGEYCTSLEMAGASITLVKLDDECPSSVRRPYSEAQGLPSTLNSHGSVAPPWAETTTDGALEVIFTSTPPSSRGTLTLQ